MDIGNTEQLENDTKAAPAESTAGAGEKPAARVARTSWIRRFFWLDEKIVQANVSSLGPKRPGWNEFRLALEAHAGFEEIKESGESRFAALLLVRSEVLLLLRCHMHRAGIDVPDSAMSLEDLARARQIPLVGNMWNELPRTLLANVESCFGPNTETFFIDQDASHRVALVLTLTEMSSLLRKPLEHTASEVGRLIARRWSRIGAALAVAVVSLWALIGWSMDRAGGVNLALNRRVTTSSQMGGANSDHPLLVDGNVTNLGFHTDSAPNQFVVIDLGGIKKFDKVVVYNRTDCCKERAVPVRLEVSDDGVNYRKLEDRIEVFDVWTAKMLRARGRYVRLRLLQVNFFHLNEVEIY